MEVLVATPSPQFRPEALAASIEKRLAEELPWFLEMPQTRQHSVMNVVKNGLTYFKQLLDDKADSTLLASQAFETAPKELLRSVSLQETLEITRVIASSLESALGKEYQQLIDAFAKQTAFAAADIYARASRSRSIWDDRLEALIIDAVISGESDAEVASRASALGWRGHGAIAVMVGIIQGEVDFDQYRKLARLKSADVLIGRQGNHLILITGFRDSEMATGENLFDLARDFATVSKPGPVVMGPRVESINLARRSSRAAFGAMKVVRHQTHGRKAFRSREYLAERAVIGEAEAQRALIREVYQKLQADNLQLLETLEMFFENNASIEKTANELFIHPNTVRYRLSSIEKELGLDPLESKGQFTLRIALSLGRVQTQPRTQGLS
ncbi:MAG: helix-turn-helix domain-containing protein [Microbacteriaceae bacterium]|nr:helix-turn-helix domain-containing protein [Microbacteriaceae bacterium]